MGDRARSDTGWTTAGQVAMGSTPPGAVFQAASAGVEAYQHPTPGTVALALVAIIAVPLPGSGASHALPALVRSEIREESANLLRQGLLRAAREGVDPLLAAVPREIKAHAQFRAIATRHGGKLTDTGIREAYAMIEANRQGLFHSFAPSADANYDFLVNGTTKLDLKTALLRPEEVVGTDLGEWAVGWVKDVMDEIAKGEDVLVDLTFATPEQGEILTRALLERADEIAGHAYLLVGGR